MTHTEGELSGSKTFIMLCKNENEELIQKLEFVLSADKTFSMNIPRGQAEKLENIFVMIQYLDQESEPITIGRFFVGYFNCRILWVPF